MPRAAILVILATLTASIFIPSAFDRASLAASGAATTLTFDEGYVCYRGQFSGFRRPKSIVFRDVLADRLRTLRVGSPYYVCAPATSGLPPPAKGYLVCYPTPLAKLGVARRLATKMLGDLTMPRASLRDLVCVESDRLDQRGRPSTSRVFICYRSGKPRTGDRTVRLRDAFRRTEDAVAGVPYRGCAAAPSLPISGASYLVCSTISPGRPAGSLVLKNRFGYVKAVLGSRATLCLKAKPAR